MEKIIHQIWMQGENEIPEKLKMNMKRIKDMNPGIKYMFWDSDQILNIMHKHKKYYKSYNEFTYLHQKVDFAKLVILYEYGGIFIDMDAYTHQPINSLFDRYSNQDLVVSKVKTVNGLTNYAVCGDTNFCINNGIYMAKSGADVLLYLIDEISKKTKCGIFQNQVTCIRHTTGPLTFDTLIKIYMKRDNKAFSNSSKSRITILPYNVMEPCIYDECDISDETYIIHKHENTWIGQSTKWIMQTYVAHHSIVHAIILLILLILLISYFSKKPLDIGSKL